MEAGVKLRGTICHWMLWGRDPKHCRLGLPLYPPVSSPNQLKFMHVADYLTPKHEGLWNLAGLSVLGNQTCNVMYLTPPLHVQDLALSGYVN